MDRNIMNILKSGRLMGSENELAESLDATSFILLHGDREQQIEAANDIRSLLSIRGHPVRDSRPVHFEVTARIAEGTYVYDVRGYNSIDALLEVLGVLNDIPVAVSVARGSKK